MKELELYYPAKPYKITQAWGIKNLSYQDAGFDFTRHNGIDFAVDEDKVVRAMCPGVVTETGYNSTAGNYVRYKTNELVMCEGVPCFVYFLYAHGERVLVKQGDRVVAGDELLVAGNTGFSTGPHTHISAWRQDAYGVRLDTDKETNRTFDHSKYFNGFYADHAKFLELMRDLPVFKQVFDIMKSLR